MSGSTLALVLGLGLGLGIPALVIIWLAFLSNRNNGTHVVPAQPFLVFGGYAEYTALLARLEELSITVADGLDGHTGRLDDHDGRIETLDTYRRAHAAIWRGQEGRLSGHDTDLAALRARVAALEADRVTNAQLDRFYRRVLRLLQHHTHAAASRFSWWWVLVGAVIGGLGFLVINRVIKPGTVSAVHFPSSRYLFGSPWHTLGMAIFMTAMGMLIGGAAGGLISAARRSRVEEDEVTETEITEHQA